jgi:hypothetical protein
MSKRCRIYHDACCVFAGFVDPIYNFIFAVALMELQLKTELGGNVATDYLDVRKGLAAINGRLALAK